MVLILRDDPVIEVFDTLDNAPSWILASLRTHLVNREKA